MIAALSRTLVAAVLLVSAVGVHANTITVNDASDNGAGCTLRKALTNANNNTQSEAACATGSGADHIVFDLAVFPAGSLTPIVLGSELVLRDTATTMIDGDRRVAVDGGGVTRVFAQYVINTDSELHRLTIRGGKLQSSPGAGLRILRGTVTVSECNISGNSIYVGGNGGGIFVDTEGTLHLRDSTLSSNVATSFGGGIFSRGAITVSNSTLSLNTADNGAGIHIQRGTAIVSDTTMSGNVANDSGGSVLIDSGTSTSFSRMLLLEHFATNGNNCAGVASFTDSLQYGDDSSCTGAVQVSLAELDLSPMQNNGGSTHTRLPGAGSVAIDAAACASPPGTDQRGLARGQDVPGVGSDTVSLCDIGAVERQVISNAVFANSFE